MASLPFPKFLKLLETLESDEEACKKAIIARCATDIHLFSQIFFPHYCTFPFNLFHYDTFKDYKYGERAVRRASAAPRGFAKSTIKALIKPIHDVVYRLEKFIVIVSNTEPQASQKAKDISTEFLTNNTLKDFYGSWLSGRKVGATDFILNQDDFSCRIYAVGSKTEIRGIRFGEARPSKIVCDDVEHSTEVENEAIREKYEDWYKEVISKIGDTKTNIEFVGTVLHRKSLLKSLVNNPKYKSREYKAIISWSDRPDLWKEWKKIYCNLDDDERQDHALSYFKENEEEMMKGVEVLWPEKESYYHLQEEIIETGMRAFMKEKQNSPMSDEEKVFDPEDFWWYEQTTENGQEGFLIERTGVFIPLEHLQPLGVIDPSTGQKKPSANVKTDFTCILTGYKDPLSKRLFVHADFTKRTSPSKYVRQIFENNEIYQYYRFGIETNLFRGLLVKNILEEKKRQELNKTMPINIKFYDIVQTENKEKRIYTIEPKVSNGYILFNKTMLSQEFKDQMWEFPKGKHDDCPDALEMLWSLADNKYKAGSLGRGMMT
jgi:predicted phage terminase large subunit-like protein